MLLHPGRPMAAIGEPISPAMQNFVKHCQPHGSINHRERDQRS
jgi:hypothetical protein